MRDIDIDRLKRYNLSPKDFQPSLEQTTIEDLIEALDILTSIVLEDNTND